MVAVHFVGEKRAHGRVYDKQDKCLPLQAIAEEYTLRQHVFSLISRAKDPPEDNPCEANENN